MPKIHLKILELSLLIFTLIQASSSKSQQESFALAKRNLIQREREFFKTKPISEDLRSFIKKYRHKKHNNLEATRKKRSDGIDENLLYVVKNGQLVPYKNLKTKKRSDDGIEQQNEQISYTVVPLVIPLNMKAPASKLIKTRNLGEELQSGQVSNESPASPSSVGDDSSSSIRPAEKGKSEGKSEIEEANLDNEEGSDNNTKEETQVLHKILQDVEGLMQWKHEGNKKEGVLCNINGSWISDAAGMRFDICYQNATRKKFRIHVADRIPPNEDGFLCDGNWTVFGEVPFTHSGMIIALAVHEKDKHIATFIGECRICEGSETVTGTWLIGRSSRDCKDQKASHKILSDVWKREQAHSLRKKHLQQIGYDVKNED